MGRHKHHVQDDPCGFAVPRKLLKCQPEKQGKAVFCYPGGPSLREPKKTRAMVEPDSRTLDPLPDIKLDKEDCG